MSVPDFNTDFRTSLSSISEDGDLLLPYWNTIEEKMFFAIAKVDFSPAIPLFFGPPIISDIRTFLFDVPEWRNYARGVELQTVSGGFLLTLNERWSEPSTASTTTVLTNGYSITIWSKPFTTRASYTAPWMVRQTWNYTGPTPMEETGVRRTTYLTTLDFSPASFPLKTISSCKAAVTDPYCWLRSLPKAAFA
jgi:hypothetical protein